ncbi:MAG: GNAT family N-acetyltransferase [Actinomycetia bacterium]|nr:GNAT family N-acetyltransferase [Actinomycetes bacterium]
MLTRETITVGSQRFRVGPWQADSGVAHLSLPPRATRPTTQDLRAALEAVTARGYTSVLTSALEETETAPFTLLGFSEHDRLNVLVHRLANVEQIGPTPRRVRLRRGRRGDRSDALAVDAAAFPDFWRLDAEGLADAEAATPTSRFRVAIADGRVVGYAITGRGGDSGFLQRLATDPAVQRLGIGSALVGDALRWSIKRRCRQVYVNTQVGNAAALSLYRRLGFESTGNDLVVLSWTPE